MSYFKGALEEDYKKIGKLYHGRRKKRNLLIINTVFIFFAIVAIMLPLKWYYNVLILFILLVMYGVARLWSLND